MVTEAQVHISDRRREEGGAYLEITLYDGCTFNFHR